MDIYAGTLARYYSRTWETIAQREFGAELIFSGGKPNYPNYSDARDLIENWRSNLRSSLANPPEDICEWDESEDKPYYSDKPDYEGHASLIAWAVYLDQDDLSRPKSRIDLEKLVSDPAYLNAIDRSKPNPYVAVLESQLFLPSKQSLQFHAEGPNGNTIPISTNSALRLVLETMNAKSWNGSRDEICRWRMDGLPADEVAEIEEYRPFGFLPKKQRLKMTKLPVVRDELQQAAQYAYAIYWTALEFSEVHDVPMILDY